MTKAVGFSSLLPDGLKSQVIGLRDSLKRSSAQLKLMTAAFT